MTVIARFSYFRLLRAFGPVWVFVAIAVLLTANAFEERDWRAVQVWCLVGLFFLGLSIWAFAAVMGSRGKAIWIEDGRLFTPHWSAPTNEIRTILLKQQAQLTVDIWQRWYARRDDGVVLAINRVNGETETVTMNALKEPMEVVTERLRTVLALRAAIDIGTTDRPWRKRARWSWWSLVISLGLAVWLVAGAMEAWDTGKTGQAIAYVLLIPFFVWAGLLK